MQLSGSIKLLFLSLPLIMTTINKVPAQNLEIGGLVLDLTKTRIGHEFYESFYLCFQEEPLPTELKEKVNIVVEEFTDPKYGTRIVVKVGETITYVDNIAPRKIEESAKRACEHTANYIFNLEEFEKSMEEEIR
ncbi:MAG: CsgE family curli-type amyloid fiber assembly protein [Thermosulfidibacteraceae bacterium]